MWTIRRFGLAVALLAVTTLAVAACGDDDTGSGTGDAVASSSNDVEGVTWQLTELEGEPLPEGVAVTLEYDGATVSGSGGCNSYSGSATFDDGVVDVSSELAATLMGCEAKVSEVESRYMQALPTATEFQVDEDTLTLSAGGEALLVYSAG